MQTLQVKTNPLNREHFGNKYLNNGDITEDVRALIGDSSADVEATKTKIEEYILSYKKSLDKAWANCREAYKHSQSIKTLKTELDQSRVTILGKIAKFILAYPCIETVTRIFTRTIGPLIEIMDVQTDLRGKITQQKNLNQKATERLELNTKLAEQSKSELESFINGIHHRRVAMEKIYALLKSAEVPRNSIKEKLTIKHDDNILRIQLKSIISPNTSPPASHFFRNSSQ